MLRYKRIATTSTGIIASANSNTELWSVNINTGATSAVFKLYDGTSASGTLIATIDASTKSSHAYGVLCNGGIFFDLSGGNADITVGYA